MILQFNSYSDPTFDELYNLPIIFLGFNIKCAFDKELEIPKKYNPMYFKHYSKINMDILKDFYYYGIEIYNKNDKINELINKLNNISKNEDIITQTAYIELLKKYNLTCDTCYRHFQIGCYPLDISNLSAFIDNTNSQQITSDFFAIKDDAINNIAGLHLQILTEHPSFDYNCIVTHDNYLD